MKPKPESKKAKLNVQNIRHTHIIRHAHVKYNNSSDVSNKHITHKYITHKSLEWLDILLAPILVSVFVSASLTVRFLRNPSLPFTSSYANLNSNTIRFLSHIFNYSMVNNPQLTGLLLSLACFITTLFLCLTIRNIFSSRLKKVFFVNTKNKDKQFLFYLLLALLFITNPVFIASFTSLTPWFVIITLSTIALFLITTKKGLLQIIGLAFLALLPAIENSFSLFLYVITLFILIALVFKALKLFIAGSVLTLSTTISSGLNILNIKPSIGLRLAELGFDNGFSLFLFLLAIISLVSIKPKSYRALAFTSLILAVIFSPNIGIAFIISALISVLGLITIINLAYRHWSLKALKNLALFIISLMILFFMLSNFFMVIKATPNTNLLYTLKLAGNLHERLLVTGDSAIIAKGLGLNVFNISKNSSETFNTLMSRDFGVVKEWLRNNDIGLVLIDDSDLWRHSGFLFLQRNANLCSLISSKGDIFLYSC